MENTPKYKVQVDLKPELFSHKDSAYIFTLKGSKVMSKYARVTFEAFTLEEVTTTIPFGQIDNMWIFEYGII
jgi:hypothetical protein